MLRPAIAALAASLSLAAPAFADTSGNLLVNPGAETGDLTGWTVGGESNPGVDNGTFDPPIQPYEGLYSFYGGRGAEGTLTQNVALTGEGLARMLDVSFTQQGLDQALKSDSGYVSLTYYALDGTVLGSAESPLVDSHDERWRTWDGSFDVPLAAVSVDYTMHFVRQYGIDNDAFIDANSLTLVTAVPEPAEALMLLPGLALVGWMARRRRRGAAQ